MWRRVGGGGEEEEEEEEEKEEEEEEEAEDEEGEILVIFLSAYINYLIQRSSSHCWNRWEKRWQN